MDVFITISIKLEIGENMVGDRRLLKKFSFFTTSLLKNFTDYNTRRNSYYLKNLRSRNIDNKCILFESYHGISFTGNVYALFRYMVENDYKYKFYIVIRDIENPMIKWIKKKYHNNKNIVIIKYQSKRYLKILATAKYLVNDTTFLPYFSKRQEQVYINTWHGTPFKKIGNDINNSVYGDNKNVQKNLMSANKLAMPNKFTAQKLANSNNLLGILNSEISYTGNARMDLTLHSKKEEVCCKYDLDNKKKIVLYAPTYKAKSRTEKTNDIIGLIKERNIIQKELGNDYIVYLKTHYLIEENIETLYVDDYVIPNWYDTNELISVVDILITDYSSIFFDYIPLKKPIYFYMKDKEVYESERGLYLDVEKLPGSVSYCLDDLLKNLRVPKSIYLNNYSFMIEKFIDSYCSYDDGKASLRTLNFMLGKFNGEKLYKSNKKVIAIYGGGFYNNGITQSLINMSKALDYSKYEIIVIDNDKIFNDKLYNIMRLNSKVHIITLFSEINRNVLDTLALDIFNRHGLNSKYLKKERIEKIFKEYFNQVFGNTTPEVVIDYSGYNKTFTSLFAFSPVKKKVIYLHNDMHEEFNKYIDGRYKHRWNLKVIFSLYDEFTRIVSVSESANESNIKNLKQYLNSSLEKMITISNIIDGDYIIEKASDISPKIFPYEDIDDILLKDKTNINQYLKKIMKSDQNINFITLGRLSPEKNHEKLIKAFREIVNENNQCKLYILGEGPLYNYLKTLIVKLDLKEYVYLLGYVRNPYPFLYNCDCFILPSNYEGQGISILEAQILEKPVIGTNVNGIKSVINKESGLLIENDLQSIVEGMKEYLNGNIPQKKIDYIEYNETVMMKMEKEIF